MNILDSVSNIMVDVLDDEDLVVTRETTADDAEDWDSLAQIQMILAIEKEFGVKFGLEEVQQLNQIDNVGDMVDIVARKLGVD